MNSKQLEIKFFPHGIGRETQTVTYDTVKDHIVQYVQKTLKNADPVANRNEQARMDIMYQAKLKRYLEQKDTLEHNLTKAYALIFSTDCNKTMHNRIEEHLDFETTIHDDPIELLSKIKVLMHDPIRAKYPFALLTEAIIRMLNIKQIENEGWLDYVKQFKQSRDITKSHVGTDILDKFVENTCEYQEEEYAIKKKEMKDGVFNKWMAYLLIHNSNQSKYGSLLNRLVLQFSMDNSQHPKNIMGATDTEQP
jgi:hypothetical protein